MYKYATSHLYRRSRAAMALVVQCKARMGSQFVCEREGGGSRCHCYTTLDHVVDMAATSALTVTQVIAGVVDYRITSLACWHDKVVAGCHDGSLRVFARGTGAGRAEFHPIFTKAAFAPRPIDSVVIIDPVDVIVSISDAVCSVHDLASFAQVDTLDTGGSRCVSLAVNASCRQRAGAGPLPHPFLIAVLSRSKLHVYQWKGPHLRFQTVKAFNLQADRVTDVEFIHDTAVCLAFRNRYEVLHLDTGLVDEFARIPADDASAAPSPSLYRRTGPQRRSCCAATLLDRGTSTALVAVAVNSTAHLYTMTGNAAPVAVPEKTFAVDRPIVGLVLMRPMIVLLTQDRIHPFHMEVDGSAATFRSVSFLDGFALHSNASEMAFVASDSAIAFLERVPDQDLAEDLCRTRRFEAAVAVLRSPGRDPDVTGGQLMSARERDLARVYGQYADDLFQSGRYAASLKAFQQSDVDPSTVLTRFNGLSSDAMCDQTVAALMPYLLHLRSRLPRQQPPSSAAPLTSADFAVVVDTMLLRTYLKADRRLVIPFLSQSPLVDVDQAAAALTSAGQFDALLFLYESRAMHDRALSLLQGLADSTTGTLSGTLPTIHYLRRLMDEDAIHHWDLIRRHAVWALDRDPITAAVKIFAYHHRRRSSVGSGEAHRTTIGPTAIIDYLKERAPVQAAIAFLEAYIANTGTTLAPIHNELAHLYMSAILQPGAPVDAGRRMQDFLCRCQYVDLPALLQDMPADKGDLLASERAVVLHRLGRSDEALRELVEHQGALAAIGFCNTHAPSSATRLHMQLLRVFLQPAAGDPMIEPALQLLHSHYRHLDACEVVKLLPDTLPVDRVREYVEKTVGHHLEVHRRNQIEKHLCRGQHRQAHLDLYARQRPRVVVDGCGRCDSCGQPIADPNVVVVRYPSGAVIDYKCMPNL